MAAQTWNAGRIDRMDYQQTDREWRETLQFHAPELQPWVDPVFSGKDVSVSVLRLDLMDALLGGNKWFKISGNLNEALRLGTRRILTFGGAFSNHLLAVAEAGRRLGFQTIGLVRGEATSGKNDTLQLAQRAGMKLHFISREEYRQKDQPAFLRAWQEAEGPFLLIPEGGANAAGRKGAGDILQYLSIPYDHLLCACGTGTTLAGLAAKLPEGRRITGICVLKGDGMLDDKIRAWVPQSNWRMEYAYHFGGYARHQPGLLSFMQGLYVETGIPTEPVYSAKLFYAVKDLALRDYFTAGTKLIVLHCGGLQGKTFTDVYNNAKAGGG